MNRGLPSDLQRTGRTLDFRYYQTRMAYVYAALLTLTPIHNFWVYLRPDQRRRGMAFHSAEARAHSLAFDRLRLETGDQ